MSKNVKLMHAARKIHARGDFAAALKSYESILRADPKDYEVAYQLAVALYQSGALESAAEAFAECTRLNPRNEEPYKDRGLVLMKLGQYAQALDSFENALRISPSSPEYLLNRGLAQKNLGRLDDSVRSYNAALALRPRFPEAYNNLANSLSLLGRKEEALANYAKAYTFKPQYTEALMNAASVLQELGRHGEAKSCLDRLIATSPHHAEAQRSLAQSLLMLGQTVEAFNMVSSAIVIDPMFVTAYLTRAEICCALGRDFEAINDYSRALDLEPGNKEALLEKARLLCKHSQHEVAIGLCDLAIAIDPNDAKAYFQIGRAFEGKHELKAAAISYAKASALNPQWLSPSLQWGRTLLSLDNKEEALKVLDQAIISHADSAEAHLCRGDIQRELRRFDDALASYDRAVELAPDQAKFYDIRGSLRTEIGRRDDALEDFGKALTIIAAEWSSGEDIVADCVKLLSVDKIPAIYETETELAETRDRVETTLTELRLKYADVDALCAEQRRVSEHAICHLTGFYLAYHQRNDRETMRNLSTVAGRLLAVSHWAPPDRRKGGKIRLGIASQRLRDHNGANWAYNWFAHLPKNDYEFYTYNFENSSDELAQQFAKLGTHRTPSSLRASPSEILQQIRDDELDILMLTDVGMTPVSRFLSLHRIAACQFTGWGHPVTTGSTQMDFYLSSDLMEPPDASEHYTETLVRMPNLALYLDRPVVDPGKAETNFGLPTGRVLYGCLQSLFKYLPRYDDILPRIAREVPEALFVFLEGQPSYMTVVLKRRLEYAFSKHGLDAKRYVVFLPRQTPRDFDYLMREMDVCIDSIGWSGGNTSLKCINFSIPLATLEGEFMRGRHSSAMFRMIGAEEMIATTVTDYITLLAKLGKEESYRRHCNELFERGRWHMYQDTSFVVAFDAFLKANVRH